MLITLTALTRQGPRDVVVSGADDANAGEVAAAPGPYQALLVTKPPTGPSAGRRGWRRWSRSPGIAATRTDRSRVAALVRGQAWDSRVERRFG